MRVIPVAALLLTSFTCAFGTAAAQKPTARQAGAPARAIVWRDLMGEWTGHSYRGQSDSVISVVTVRFGAGRKVTVQRDKQAPAVAHVVTMAGDSVVVEYDAPSITRAGHKVSVRETYHVANHRIDGRFHAAFDDGRTLDGRVDLAHRMK